MNLRILGILAGVVLAGAIAGWILFGGGSSLPPDAEAPGTSIVPAVPVSPSPDAHPTNSAPAPRASAGTPAVPARNFSSVVPGMPMSRSESAEKAPPETALKVDVHAPAPPAFSQREGVADVDNVQSMLRDFRTRLGENPVGSNAEIMKSVMGGNSVHARLGPPEGQSINEQGELTDRWGTPYFFHQLSKDGMEVRSAGPDRKLYTGDDIVTK